jgi:hypothetical protein
MGQLGRLGQFCSLGQLTRGVHERSKVKILMPRNAKLYIALIIASGLAILLLAARSWAPANLKEFAIFLGLAVLASTLKIRIPGIESTITPNFVFLLLAVNVCSFSEVVVMAVASALIQCLWRSTKRPRLIQVAFSAAVLVLSIAVAYQLSHLLLTGNSWDSSIGTLILAGSIYFPLNASLVAVVLGMVSGESFRQIFARCERVAVPYFMCGVVFAALATSGYNSSWKAAVILIPAVMLAHLYFQSRTASPLTAKIPS